MMRRWLAWLVTAVVAGILAAVAISGRPAGSEPSPPSTEQPHDAAAPDPRWTPDQVVRFQLEALRQNDQANRGIAQAYRFASPGNRAQIGSIEQFIQIVRSPAYRAMINHVWAMFDRIQVEGDRAQQAVMLTGPNRELATYVFLLSRQRGGAFDGCWMTDGVMRVETPPPMDLPDEQQPVKSPPVRNDTPA